MSHMSNSRIAFEIDDGVAEVRFAHPERRNCLSEKMFEDLHDAFREIDERLNEVTAILMTNERPIFCSGLDLDVFLGEDATDKEERIRGYYDACFEWLSNVDRPVIVASDGPAIASGGGFVLRSDINIVSPDFEIWFPEININVISLGQAPRFIKYFGIHRAAGMTFLGEDEPLSADEARELGLVNRIAESETIDDTARELADKMAETQREYGTLLDAYEVFNLAKQEHLSVAPTAQKRISYKETREDWFSGD